MSAKNNRRHRWLQPFSSSSPKTLGFSTHIYGNHNPITYISSSPGPSSGWTYDSGAYTVPSNGAYVLLYAQIYLPSAPSVLRVDDAFLAIGRTATTAVDNLDYLPFGEQITGDTGTTHKFTGKERDSESGLDYFGARFYASSTGRWMSPDWAAKPEAVPYSDLEDPQSLNLYGYVRNNPLSKEDPDGHNLIDWLKRQGCNLGMSSQCTPPPQQQQQQNQQQQEQKLVNAQDNARNNPAFQPSAGTTHCDQATCSVVQQTGAPTGPLVDKNGKPVSANQQAQNLANSSQYREVTPQQTQQIANNGGVVIVAYDNPNGHGHTATVRPQGVAGDNPPARGRGPLINDIGRNVRVANENYTFRRGTEVHYYTPRGQ